MQEEKESKQEELSDKENEVEVYLKLASDTVDLLHFVTKVIKGPFLVKVRAFG